MVTDDLKWQNNHCNHSKGRDSRHYWGQNMTVPRSFQNVGSINVAGYLIIHNFCLTNLYYIAIITIATFNAVLANFMWWPKIQALCKWWEDTFDLEIHFFQTSFNSQVDNGFKLVGGGRVYLAQEAANDFSNPFIYWQVRLSIVIYWQVCRSFFWCWS